MAKASTSPLYAKYYVVVEEHFYDFTLTRIELGGKQIFIRVIGEDFHSHDEEHTIITSTIQSRTIRSNREKSLIVLGVCYQREGGKDRVLIRPRILTPFPRLVCSRPAYHLAFGLLQVQSVLPARGARVEVGFLADTTDSITNALRCIVECRRLKLVSDFNRRAFANKSAYVSVEKYSRGIRLCCPR